MLLILLPALLPSVSALWHTGQFHKSDVVHVNILSAASFLHLCFRCLKPTVALQQVLNVLVRLPAIISKISCC